MTPRSQWIVGPRYDSLWFLGGALLTLLVLLLYFGLGGSIVVLCWVWMLGLVGAGKVTPAQLFP